MGRRRFIVTELLVLVLIAVLALEAGSALRRTPGEARAVAAPTAMSGPNGIALPRPSPTPPPEAGLQTMSGDFADRFVACLGAGPAPPPAGPGPSVGAA